MIKLNFNFIIIINLLFIFKLAVAVDQQGFHYTTKYFNGVLIEIITVDPNDYRIINVSAKQINKNAAYVAEFAKQYSQALMVINGGFFREVFDNLYVPAGVLKINHVWQGIAYHPRAAIGWGVSSNVVLIDRVKTNTYIRLNHHKLPVSHFNPDLNIIKNYKILVYSTVYPNFENLLNIEENFYIGDPKNYNYIVNINKLNYSFDRKNLGATALEIELFPELSPDNQQLWQDMPYITSGSPILVKNNQLITNFSAEKLSSNFLDGKHARSAVCIANGNIWNFIKTGELTVLDLSKIMQLLDCKDAINLDGGRSSDLYMSSNYQQVASLPKLVVPVTDVIMVLPK